MSVKFTTRSNLSRVPAILLLSMIMLAHAHTVTAQEAGSEIVNGLQDRRVRTLAAPGVALHTVAPLTISHDWFTTAMVPPAFFFGAEGTFSSDEFTVNALEPVMLSVTDDFCKGDRFEVFDNGVSIGATSVPVDESPGCSPLIGPDAAFADPDYSSGSFILDSGFHHIQIKAIKSPFGFGQGYIEVHEAPVEYEYAAKVVCGVQRNPLDMRLARGFYATTINIHNPNAETAVFFKKLALTFPPEEQEPGKIYKIAIDTLRYDEALAVDCMDIRREVFPNGFPAAYIEGFVVVQSPQSLDVVGVYSTATIDRQGRAANQSSIHVEPIPERVTMPRRPPPTTPTPLPDLGHFQCYNTPTTQPVDSLVFLEDQFGRKEALVLESLRFCNPVEKIHTDASGRLTVTPIPDEDHHLTFYRIDTAPPDSQFVVSVSNQFGEDQKLEVTEPLFLAVPTQKLSPRQHAPPEGLDHFKCYAVLGEPVDAPVELNDQFNDGPQIRATSVVALCNPVDKTHGDIVIRRQHPDDHLVCYRIDAIPFGLDVSTFNQFGDASFHAERPDLLCAPSKKTVLQ